MSGAEVVCQVIGEAENVRFIWSDGPASFEPYDLNGQGLLNFRKLAGEARRALSDLVKDYLHGTDDDLRMSSLAVAKVGHKLYQQVFRPAAGPALYTAKRARAWLEQMRERGEVCSLEIVIDKATEAVPWNLVYEGEPSEVGFLNGGDDRSCWEPFWGIRYNLACGRRVEPLRRLPWLDKPKLLMVIDPGIRAGLPPPQQERLDAFAKEHGVKVVGSRDDLSSEMEDVRPDVMYWLCHADPTALILADQPVSPVDLLELYRAGGDEDAVGGLAFLNACRTAESGEVGSFISALHEVGLSGVIATEHQTVDTFANPFGLDFLEAFLYKGERLGEALQALRSRNIPLGLLYSTYCPPDIRVRQGQETPNGPRVLAPARLSGIALGVDTVSAPLRKSAPPPLPDEPYRLLGAFEREDRALFVGRDDDVRRFALILDDPKARVVVLHGESGVGKSSFLRAGVIPYLEDDCVGYRFLSVKTGEGDARRPRFVRATYDLVGQVARVVCDFCAEAYTFSTPGESAQVVVDLAAEAAEAVGAELRVDTLSAVLRRDPSTLGRLLRAVSAKLPHALVLVIDQAEEVFTLARSLGDGRPRADLEMIRKAIGIPGNYKIILSLRTEYYGRLVDRLRGGVRDVVGVREYLLTDFDQKGLVAAIMRPASDEPVEGTGEVPSAKYRFGFAPGVARQIAAEILDPKGRGQDSVLPLAQVICAQLYERARSGDGVIRLEDFEAIGGVRGGMRRHVETLASRLLTDEAGDLVVFKRLLTRLYLRQPDGALTTALLPRDALAGSWTGQTDFNDLLRGACDLRLLKLNLLATADGTDRPYVSLGHDALAAVASAWDDDFRRWKRLRKWAAAAASALLLAAVMSGLAAFAEVQRRNADRARAHAEAERLRALSFLQETVEALDQSLTKVAEDDLVDVPQMVRKRKELLESSKAGFFALRSKYENDLHSPNAPVEPLFRDNLERAVVSLADIERQTGEYQPAKDDYDSALRLLAHSQSIDGARFRNGTLLGRAEHGLGETLRRLNDFDGARAAFEKAVATRRKLLNSPGGPRALAESYNALAALLFHFTDGPEAAEFYRQALDVLSAHEGDLVTPQDNVSRARYLNNRGRLRERSGDLKNALRDFLEAKALLDGAPPAADTPALRWQLARSENNAGALTMDEADRVESDDRGLLLIERARRRLGGLVRDFPEIPQYRSELASVCQNLGDLASNEYFDAFIDKAASTPEGKDREGRARAKTVECFRESLEVLSGLREDPPGVESEWVRSTSEFELALVGFMSRRVTGRFDEQVEAVLKKLDGLDSLIGRVSSRSAGGATFPNFRRKRDEYRSVVSTVFWGLTIRAENPPLTGAEQDYLRSQSLTLLKAAAEGRDQAGDATAAKELRARIGRLEARMKRATRPVGRGPAGLDRNATSL